MDDEGSVLFATDCAPSDSERRDLPEASPTDIPFKDEPVPTLLGSEEEEATITASAPLNTDEMTTAQIIEALLFSSDAPLSALRLAELVGACTPGRIRQEIDALNEKYAQAGLSFRIEAIARGYQMMTLPASRPWVQKLHKQHSETRLSNAALETLSIIAYKQPVIRANVEAIRGVACGEVIGRLRDMGLVRIVGRAEVVGRPLLYGTTRKFLDVFGLVDLDDLPPMEALRIKSAPKPANKPPAAEPALAKPAAQLAAVGT
jgi:segregation and condensation protein B